MPSILPVTCLPFRVYTVAGWYKACHLIGSYYYLLLYHKTLHKVSASEVTYNI